MATLFRSERIRLRPWAFRPGIGLLPMGFRCTTSPVVAGVIRTSRDRGCERGRRADARRRIPSLSTTRSHTGPYCLLIESGARRALLTGDALHSPIQILHPEWSTAGDGNPKAAEQARRHIIETCTDREILLMSGHFPAPTVGRLLTVEGKPQFRFI